MTSPTTVGTARVPRSSLSTTYTMMKTSVTSRTLRSVFIVNGYGQIDKRAHVLIDALQESSASGQDNAAVVYVGRNLGAKFGQGVFYPPCDAPDDTLDDRVDLACFYLDGTGTPGLHVAA